MISDRVLITLIICVSLVIISKIGKGGGSNGKY